MKILKPATERVMIPAGKYVLGDPCYSVPDNLWEPLLDSCGTFGCSNTDKDSCVGTVEVNGKTYSVLGFGTTYGDGSYKGSDGNEYCVDAGMIGLVPLELAEMKDDFKDNYLDVGIVQIIEFTADTLCTNHKGDMVFGDIEINTGHQDEDDDYDDGADQYEDYGDESPFRMR